MIYDKDNRSLVFMINCSLNELTNLNFVINTTFLTRLNQLINQIL